MIISSDSPYRNLPSALDRKQALFLDAIRYSIDMADLAHNRLRQNLLNLTIRKAQDAPVDHWQTASVVQDAWSMVDSLHRLRGLLAQMPGWKKKASGMRVFEQHTKTIEDLRNAVQHQNHQINKVVDKNLPVWGSLSWLAVPDPTSNTGIMCFMVTGTVLSGASSAPMQVPPEGKEIDLPVDMITLAAYEHSVDLSSAMKQVARLVEGTEDQFKEQFKGYDRVGADVFVFLTVQFGEEESQTPQSPEQPAE